MAVMELREAFHLLGAESRNTALAAQQFGERGRELRQRPGRLVLGPVIVETTLGLVLCLLPMPLLEQFEILVIQRCFAWSWSRLRMSTTLALIPASDLQKLAFERMDAHLVQRGERIVVDHHPVSAIGHVHGEVLIVDLHVEELVVNLSFYLRPKQLLHVGHVDVSPKASLLAEEFARGAVRGTVDGVVVAGVQPSLEVVVELIERDGVAGSDLAFELILRGLDDAFDDAAGRRISGRTMEQVNVQLGAGQLQSTA